MSVAKAQRLTALQVPVVRKLHFCYFKRYHELSNVVTWTSGGLDCGVSKYVGIHSWEDFVPFIERPNPFASRPISLSLFGLWFHQRGFSSGLPG